MDLYKRSQTDFTKDRTKFFNIEKQYEEICYSIYHNDANDLEDLNLNILTLVQNLEIGVDIICSIEEIKNYTNQKFIQDFCLELFSPSFSDALKRIITDPQFIESSDFIISIIRNLWKMAPNDCPIFDDEIILVIIDYLAIVEPKTICLIFDAFHILLMIFPEKLHFLIERNLIDMISTFFSDLDQRLCKGRLAFPFILIQTIILLSPPASPYFGQFIDICLKYISYSYPRERVISTQCIYDMCSQNAQLISTFFSIPENIQTVINAHILNHTLQFKSLFALDTILIKFGNKIVIDYFFNDEKHVFINYLSKSVFEYYTYHNKIKEKIKPVLRFLSEVMDVIWQFLYNPELYNGGKQIPIIYRIMDISNKSTYKERVLAGNCISHFILEANKDAKLQVGQNGGFISLCGLVQDVDYETQFYILCALKELFMLNKSFINEAYQLNLQDILCEIENEACKYLISDILNYLDSSLSQNK